MGKEFSTIVTNVANEIKDTSSQMKEVIKNYCNIRYRKAVKTANWEFYNDDYTVTTVAGTASYTLPADFRKELGVCDHNGNALTYISYHALRENYGSSINEQGQPIHYTVFYDNSNVQKIRLHPVPSDAVIISVPYLVKPAALSADSDTLLEYFDDVVETGAIADSWRYKRQFAKARDFELLFENQLELIMWEMENRMNGQEDFTTAWQDYDRSIVG